MASEITSAIIGLAGAVIGGGITSFTTWQIARGERSKFARDRIWDIRRETYTHLVASLAAITRYAGKIEYEWSDEAGGDTYLNSERHREQVNHLMTMQRDLERSYANANVVISAEIAGHLEELLNLLEAVRNDRELLPEELSAEERRLFSEAHGKVLASSKRQLGVPD